MIVFGLLSSLFDILTFITLLPGIPRQRHPVRSGWFIEPAITELAVTLVLRTNRPSATQGKDRARTGRHGPLTAPRTRRGGRTAGFAWQRRRTFVSDMAGA
jgi:hypothetical protein